MDIIPNYCMQESFALLKTNSISFVGLYYSVPDVLCGTEKNIFKSDNLFPDIFSSGTHREMNVIGQQSNIWDHFGC